MGGPKAVPEPVSRRFRCLWICMVWDFIIIFCRTFMESIVERANGFRCPQRPVGVIKRRIRSQSVKSTRERKQKFNFCSYVRLQNWSFFELKTRQRRPHFMCGWGLVLFFSPFVLQPYLVSKFLRKTYICGARWPPPAPSVVLELGS